MRFFHLGDLHFGKLVHNVPMVEYDQPFWVERFLEAVDEYRPDGILIAGDVYDRQIPSKEAVNLLDYMLTELANRKVEVFMIAGNHDSGERLSFAEDILDPQGIHIAGTVEKQMKKYTRTDEHGDVHIYLMPYLYPKAVTGKDILDNDEISGYDEAVRAYLEIQDVDENARNVIVIHQNVLNHGEKPEHSESETIIGGLGEIEADAFDKFDYVAMGHIHNAQKVGREEVRYAGCPIYYDFSEEKRWKGITMIDLDGQGKSKITFIDVPILHKMKVLKGHLEDVLREGRKMERLEEYYIKTILTDTYLPTGTLDRLSEVFGNSLMTTERQPEQSKGDSLLNDTSLDVEHLDLKSLFVHFYEGRTKNFLDEQQEKAVDYIVEQQSRHGDSYYMDWRHVSKAETDELIDFVMGMEGK